MARRDEPVFGELVAIPWGLGEVYCYVHEIYGRPDRRYVILRSEPELSHYMLDDETTVVVPLEQVRRLGPEESTSALTTTAR
ncbi:MAG: hypothetical protein KY462_13795 [Actinobacteria bacterium]|nr:hypothetical protein [Actinomycetota bacterium]